VKEVQYDEELKTNDLEAKVLQVEEEKNPVSDSVEEIPSDIIQSLQDSSEENRENNLVKDINSSDATEFNETIEVKKCDDQQNDTDISVEKQNNHQSVENKNCEAIEEMEDNLNTSEKSSEDNMVTELSDRTSNNENATATDGPSEEICTVEKESTCDVQVEGEDLNSSLNLEEKNDNVDDIVLIEEENEMQNKSPVINDSVSTSKTQNEIPLVASQDDDNMVEASMEKTSKVVDEVEDPLEEVPGDVEKDEASTGNSDTTEVIGEGMENNSSDAVDSKSKETNGDSTENEGNLKDNEEVESVGDELILENDECLDSEEETEDQTSITQKDDKTCEVVEIEVLDISDDEDELVPESNSKEEVAIEKLEEKDESDVPQTSSEQTDQDDEEIICLDSEEEEERCAGVTEKDSTVDPQSEENTVATDDLSKNDERDNEKEDGSGDIVEKDPSAELAQQTDSDNDSDIVIVSEHEYDSVNDSNKSKTKVLREQVRSKKRSFDSTDKGPKNKNDNSKDKDPKNKKVDPKDKNNDRQCKNKDPKEKEKDPKDEEKDPKENDKDPKEKEMDKNKNNKEGSSKGKSRSRSSSIEIVCVRSVSRSRSRSRKRHRRRSKSSSIDRLSLLSNGRFISRSRSRSGGRSRSKSRSRGRSNSRHRTQVRGTGFMNKVKRYVELKYDKAFEAIDARMPARGGISRASYRGKWRGRGRGFNRPSVKSRLGVRPVPDNIAPVPAATPFLQVNSSNYQTAQILVRDLPINFSEREFYKLVSSTGGLVQCEYLDKEASGYAIYRNFLSAKNALSNLKGKYVGHRRITAMYTSDGLKSAQQSVNIPTSDTTGVNESNTGYGMRSNMSSGMGSKIDSGMGSIMSSCIGFNMGSGMVSNMGSGMVSNMGSGMGSNMGSGMGSNMRSDMGSNMGSSNGSNMSSGMWPNKESGMGSNMSSSMGSNMSSSMGSNMSSGIGSNMSSGMRPNMGSDMGFNMGSGMGFNMGAGLGSSMSSDIGFSMGSGPGMRSNMSSGMGSTMGSGMGSTMGSGMGSNAGRDEGYSWSRDMESNNMRKDNRYNHLESNNIGRDNRSNMGRDMESNNMAPSNMGLDNMRRDIGSNIGRNMGSNNMGRGMDSEYGRNMESNLMRRDNRSPMGRSMGSNDVEKVSNKVGRYFNDMERGMGKNACFEQQLNVNNVERDMGSNRIDRGMNNSLNRGMGASNMSGWNSNTFDNDRSNTVDNDIKSRRGRVGLGMSQEFPHHDNNDRRSALDSQMSHIDIYKNSSMQRDRPKATHSNRWDDASTSAGLMEEMRNAWTNSRVLLPPPAPAIPRDRSPQRVADRWNNRDTWDDDRLGRGTKDNPNMPMRHSNYSNRQYEDMLKSGTNNRMTSGNNSVNRMDNKIVDNEERMMRNRNTETAYSDINRGGDGDYNNFQRNRMQPRENDLQTRAEGHIFMSNNGGRNSNAAGFNMTRKRQSRF